MDQIRDVHGTHLQAGLGIRALWHPWPLGSRPYLVLRVGTRPCRPCTTSAQSHVLCWAWKAAMVHRAPHRPVGSPTGWMACQGGQHLAHDSHIECSCFKLQKHIGDCFCPYKFQTRSKTMS